MLQHIKTIRNDYLTVQINLLGASLWSITDKDGNEYLWQGNEKYWGDRAPVLFPYIARLTNGEYTLNGKKYRMDIHGFAKDSLFKIKRHDESEIVVTLSDSEDSILQYPYRFVFDITYKLEGSRIVVSFRVQNLDLSTMYFAVGGHPGFNVPFQKGDVFEDYFLEFYGEGCIRQEQFSDDCFSLGKSEVFTKLNGNVLPLTHDMFDDDAIILNGMPKTVMLKSKHGGKAVKVCYPQMDYLGLWHWPKTDAPYICIEPWSSLPSRKNIIEDLAMQENLIRLSAEESYVNSWSIEIVDT